MRGFTRTAFLGVLVSALIAPGCLDDLLGLVPDDEWGNNHSFSDAADITSRENDPLNGVLLTSPEDYFVLTTGTVGTLFITCTPAVDVNDVDVSLYDSGHGLLVSGTINGPTLEITYDDGGSGAPAGTYYILVEYTGALGGDTYILTWSLL